LIGAVAGLEHEMDAQTVHEMIDAGLSDAAAIDLTPLPPSESARIMSALENSDRVDLFCRMWERDPGRAAGVLSELDEPQALELICELCLRNMEGESRRSKNAFLLEQLSHSVPHLVREIHNYVYEVSTTRVNGTERVSYVKSEGGLNLNGSRTRFLHLSRSRHTKLTSSGVKPLSYSGGSGGDENIRASFGDGVMKWKVSLASGALDREIKVSQDTGILDNFAWHHFSLLLGRYDQEKGGTQTLMTVIPSIGKEIRCSVSMEGRRRVAMRTGEVMDARYYTVDLQGKAFVEIWVNDAGSALLLQERSQGLRVVGKELLD
jgi:hypothetical protein